MEVEGSPLIMLKYMFTVSGDGQCLVCCSPHFGLELQDSHGRGACKAVVTRIKWGLHIVPSFTERYESFCTLVHAFPLCTAVSSNALMDN